jgi:hypothetical protein
MKNDFNFKKMFLACLFFALPFFAFAGFLALLEISPIEYNGKSYSGVKGFVISILNIPFFALVFSCMNWLVLNFGNFMYKSFLNIIRK